MDVHVSAPGGTVVAEAVRDGAEPSVVWRSAARPVDVHPLPDDAPERGCRWPVALTIPTDASWPSGLYVVRLARAGADGPDPPSAWFAVRDPAPRPGRIVLALATNTWDAYNDAGGRNLYTGAVEMSSARPLTLGMLAKPRHPDERVVAQPGRAVLRRDHREADPPRGVQDGQGAGAGHRVVPGRAQREPEAIPVDRDRRPHPPPGRGRLQTNYQLRTLERCCAG